MLNNHFLQQLSKQPYYSLFDLAGRPLIVYKDHRYLIPVLWLARSSGITVEEPTMVRFDAHLDAAEFPAKLLECFRKIEDFSQAFAFAQQELDDKDDNWLSFALAAGLLGKCATIGVEPKVLDGKESPARLHAVRDLDGLRNLDSVLSTPDNDMHSAHVNHHPPIVEKTFLLDIDCDYFSFRWRTSQYAWLDRFYDVEFDPASRRCKDNNAGPSNLAMMRKLIDRSAFITIAVEPDFCGGPHEALKILSQLNRRLFSGIIDLKQLGYISTGD